MINHNHRQPNARQTQVCLSWLPGKTAKPMIVKTANSIYEIQEDQRRFRKIHDLVDPSPQPSDWMYFERMGAANLHEPLRFFWIKEAERPDSARSVLRLGVWATSPLQDIIMDDVPHGEPSGRSGWRRGAASVLLTSPPEGPASMGAERSG